MLSRSHRFHGHTAVRRAYRSGKPVRGTLMSLHVLADDRLKQGKAAVVVSKKVDKSAVRRNRIRRRVYEILRRHQSELTAPAELVFTVYATEIATIPAEQLETAVLDLLKSAHLLPK
jgi:ribonuclease P protein component